MLVVLVSIVAVAVLYVGEWIFSFLLGLALRHLGICNVVPKIRLRLGMSVVKIEVQGVDLGPQVLRVIEWPWQRWVPLRANSLTCTWAKIYVYPLNLEVKVHVKNFLLDGDVTRPAEWNADFSYWQRRMACLMKHRLVNHWTDILTGHKSLEPQLNYQGYIVDTLAQKITLEADGADIRTHERETGYEWGLKMRRFSLVPGKPTHDSMNATPRYVTLKKYRMYVNSPEHESMFSALNAAVPDPRAQRRERDDPITLADELVFRIDFPNVHTCLWQPGELPFNQGKRVRISLRGRNIHHILHDEQNYFYQFFCWRAAGNYEWRPWKRLLNARTLATEREPDEAEALLYMSLFDQLQKSGLVSFDRAKNIDTLLQLETHFTVQAIMSLRRRALNLTFSSESDEMSPVQDSLLTYDTREDPQNILMSRVLAGRRPVFDEAYCMIREVLVEVTLTLTLTLTLNLTPTPTLTLTDRSPSISSSCRFWILVWIREACRVSLCTPGRC